MARPPNRLLMSHLATFDPQISSLTLAVRQMVLEEAPDAIESISKGYALAIGFSFTGKPLKDGFCHIATYRTSSHLGFNRGAVAPGSQRSPRRHRKMSPPYQIHSENDLARPVVRRLVRAAIDQVK